MVAEYAQAVKLMGEFLKPGAVFPPEGLGGGKTQGDLAVKAIKLMAQHHIELAVLDEAAAIDGSRPLEQIADSSGIAWGGTCLQMSEDLSRFNQRIADSRAGAYPRAAGMVAADAGGVRAAHDEAGAEKDPWLDGFRCMD